MQNIIAKLLRDFDNGKMSRRQLIQSLALAATAASGVRAAVTSAPAAVSGFKTISVDHISYQVSDYARTRDFYADLMGMTVAGDNGSNSCELQFGDSVLISRTRRQRRGEAADPNPGPRIDHMAYKIADWDTDTVRAELERRGLTPRLDRKPGTNNVSFHVADPDGYDLQIAGDMKEGDSLWGTG